MKERVHMTVKIGFTAYVLLMLWLLFGQRLGADTSGTYPERIWASLNLIPFATIRHFLHTVHTTGNRYLLRHALVNLAGNVVMFIPLGFFLPCLRTKWRTFSRCMGIGTCIILVIEFLQLITLLGHCDVDNLLLNLTGIGIGFYCFTILARRSLL